MKLNLIGLPPVQMESIGTQTDGLCNCFVSSEDSHPKAELKKETWKQKLLARYYSKLKNDAIYKKLNHSRNQNLLSAMENE